MQAHVLTKDQVSLFSLRFLSPLALPHASDQSSPGGGGGGGSNIGLIIGIVIGVIAGIGVGNLAAYFLEVPPEIPIDWTILGLLICSLVGIVFGTYPAIKAANLDPIESLRYE